MTKKEPTDVSKRVAAKKVKRSGPSPRPTRKGTPAVDEEHRLADGDPPQGAVEAKESDRPNKLSDKLKQQMLPDNSPHLVVEARAGTGKTTTLIEGLKLIKGVFSSLTPSPQQQKVWDAMYLSEGKARSICFVAFNKAIATELQQRVPVGCEAMTMHSMGFKAINNCYDRVKVSNFRVSDIISELMGRDIRELRRTKQITIKAIEELVGYCKQTLLGLPLDCDTEEAAKEGFGFDAQYVTHDELDELSSYYDVDLGTYKNEIFDLVPRVLERCLDVTKDGSIDFNDMVWLPIAANLSVYKYDLLLVDEAQDLNRCQQQLALKAGKRLILVGDPKQAIYGFAGADADSMPRMVQMLGDTEKGCTVLPLTVTRRCAKAIVREAQKIVPDFEAFHSNPEGIVGRIKFEGVYDRDKDGRDTLKVAMAAAELAKIDPKKPFGEDLPDPDLSKFGYAVKVQDGDMILCRVNAPLVSQCFRFLKAGRKANIRGRDIGQGLIKLIERMKCSNIAELIEGISNNLHIEIQKENAKRNPSDQRLIALQDRHDCLMCFCEEAKTVEEVTSKIERIFTDDKSGTGISLSSGHKSKGLESRRVFILMPEGAGCPHPMAKVDWEKVQEMNLLYVMTTRAREELYYVTE